MKKVLLLTKVFLKNSLNITGNSKKKISNFIVYAMVVLYMFGVVGVLSYDLIKTLINTGFQDLGILMIVGVALSFTGLQSILVSMNVFYFSKENENILPLPIKPKELILAKIFQMLVVEDFMVLIIGIPYLVLYMILCDMGVLFLLRSILLIAIIPIISICIVTFIMMILTSINKKMRNKDVMQFLNIALVFIILFITMQSAKMEESFTTENMENFFANNEIIAMAMNDMPLIPKSMIDFCVGDRPITNLSIILILLGVTLFLFVNLSKGLYVNTLTKINTSSSSVSKSKKELLFKKKKVGIAYVAKEIKILFRNPIFFMQCILPIIIIPLIMIIPFIMELETINFEEIRNIFSTFELKIDPFLVCTALITLQLLSIFIYIAVTAFSREGASAVFSKYVPISFEKQIKYKVIPNIIFSNIWPIVLAIGIKYLMPTIDNIILILTISATFIINTIFSYIGILIDLAKPKLIWETEYAVVKNNMNMLTHSVFQSFGVAFLALATMAISHFTKNTILYLIILNVIIFIIYMFIKLYIKKNQLKLMKNIC